jgi:DnaJ-class molecular chaperone
MTAPAGKDAYYRILDVGCDATPEQIRHAYRRKVLAAHPDAGRKIASVDEFKRIRRAYEVLSDPHERQRYDMIHGLGAYADRPRFYRRSFNRLFDSLLSGLRASLRVRPPLADEVYRQRRKAG